MMRTMFGLPSPALWGWPTLKSNHIQARKARRLLEDKHGDYGTRHGLGSF